MRSSTMSSSRSYLSKHKLRESIICPIRQISGKANSKKSKNKHNDPLLEQGQIICEKQIKLLPLIQIRNNQLVMNEEGLRYLQKSSGNQTVSFVSCFGNQSMIADCILNLSKAAKSSYSHLVITSSMVGIYNFTIKRRNQTVYFIQMRCQSLHDQQKLKKALSLLSRLSTDFLIFLDELEISNKFLQILNESVKDLEQINYSHCYLIYQDQIIIEQQILMSLQEVFKSIIMASVKRTETQQKSVLSGKEVTNMKYFNIIKSLFEGSLNNKLNRFHFKGKFMKANLQFWIKQEYKPQQLTRKLYNIKLAEVKRYLECKYQQNPKADSKENLFSQIEDTQLKAIELFNSESFDEYTHEKYFRELSIFMDELEQRAKNQFHYDLEQPSCSESLLEEERQEINDKQILMSEIENLKESYDSKQERSSILSEKIIILARAAARLKVLGYDEKQKIAQMRQIIDQKWKQFKQVCQDNDRLNQQPTQQNLLREKHQLMKQKLDDTKKRVDYLKREIYLNKNLHDNFKDSQQIRLRQYDQLCRIKQKNDDIKQFISNSSAENPLIKTLQTQIIDLSQKNSQILLKKQIILETFQLEPNQQQIKT